MKNNKSLSDYLLWNNFYEFLIAGEFDENKLRKLSQVLNEDANSRDNAICIIQAIKNADGKQKARYIAWLTEATINKMLDTNQYYRLIKVVENLHRTDLEYLADNVEKCKLSLDDKHIDDFFSNGLMIIADEEYAFNEKAFDLVEFGIRYGHQIRRPSKLPSRQSVSQLKWKPS